jgi:hypothetical protein
VGRLAHEKLAGRVVGEAEQRLRDDPEHQVATAPTPTAMPVNALGRITAGPSGAGSLKNMSTMIRT